MKLLGVVAAFALICLASADEADEDIQALYECKFESGDCGFVNLADTTGRWERKEVDIGGRKGYVMLLESDGDKEVTATMHSPFFEIGKRMDICLSYDIYLIGKSAEIAVAVKHENGFSSFQKSLRKPNLEIPWKTEHVRVRVVDNVQMVFQGSVEGGKIAVDNFVFRLGKC